LLNGVREYKRVLVLGGKSDLALSTLENLRLSEDAELFLCGRNMQSLTVPATLECFQIMKIETDFSLISDSCNIIEKIFDASDIDLVILAYAFLGDESAQLLPENYEKTLKTNFLSQAMILSLIHSKLSLQMHGQILVFSSIAGARPRRRNFVYGISKFGVDFLAQGFQKLLPDNNVRITILRPGFVYSKMTANLKPAPFATHPNVVARIATNALYKNKRIAYAPRYLNIVSFVLRLIPERIFRVIDK
jgi:decaprenylphospho-beta-D-erythro-pentofuranosid-2-ulose 2-reductase